MHAKASIPSPRDTIEVPSDITRWEDLVAKLVAIKPSLSDIMVRSQGEAYLKTGGRPYNINLPPELCRTGAWEELLVQLFPQGINTRDIGEVDSSTTFGGIRMRLAVVHCLGGMEVTMRKLPLKIPPTKDLRIPDTVVREFLDLPNGGLVIIGGATGSGKSTTIASLLSHRATTKSQRIVTIEDPIEFVFPSYPNGSHFTQREVRRHTASFASALRGAMRMAPDIIYVGEVRDGDTAMISVEAALTGHIVVCTTHGGSVPSTIQRFASLLNDQTGAGTAAAPSSAVDALSQVLKLCMVQRLMHETGTVVSPVPVHEIMMMDTAIAQRIRSGNFHGIHNDISTNKQRGMQTMDMAMAERVRERLLTEEAVKNRTH